MVREHAKPEIDEFLDLKRKTRIIILDVETNGLDPNRSVLSCSAIKHDIEPNSLEMTEIDRFNRYYYPVEPFNPIAIDINGLTEAVITKNREGCTYPEHFRMDSDFEKFCGDTERFVAHNISFDTQFVPFLRGKKKFCTMTTNMDIVCTYFLKWKNNWKWPKLSETAIYYGIPFDEKELHSSIKDVELTTKIFVKMLKAAQSGESGSTTQTNESRQYLDPFHDFIWQLKNININILSQCKIGDPLNLIRNNDRDAIYSLGVATKSGEYLGDIESSDIQYYGLLHRIDHGANTIFKLKQIFTTNGNFESVNIEAFIGSPDWRNKNEIDSLNNDARKIITVAKFYENKYPDLSVSMYRKAIKMLKEIDFQCKKHFSTWRKHKFPINRLTLVLQRQGKYQECLDEIKKYEIEYDKLGLYAGEEKILMKRKDRVLEAIKKGCDKSNLGLIKNNIDYTEDQIKLLIMEHDCKEKNQQSLCKLNNVIGKKKAYMSVKLIKCDFKINSDVTHFKVKKYNCKIIYGYNYFDVPPEEPVWLNVLIEMPNGEGIFNAGDQPFEFFLYKNDLYSVDTKEDFTKDEMKLLIKHHCNKKT